MMKAVDFTIGCLASQLRVVGNIDRPILQQNQVLIRVMASACNRADILQRLGKYPISADDSKILGLEAAGVIEEIAEQCDNKKKFQLGDRVMALLSGGGNAEFVAAHIDHLMAIPERLSFEEAAAVPEVWLTAFQLFDRIGGVKSNDTVLIHAGASGVGTAAIQLANVVFNAIPIVTVGSDEKVAYVKEQFGVEHAINYKQEDFADRVLAITNDKGVNVVLDCIGGTYSSRHLKCLSIDGRWAIYGLMGGTTVDTNDFLSAILRKRIRIEGTTLRSRTIQYKASLIHDFTDRVLPYFADGKLKPVIDSVHRLEDIDRAHQRIESNESIGKVVLTVAHT